MPFCHSCGAQAYERAVVCVKCGVALYPVLPGGSSARTEESDRSWVVALLLSLFWGWLGIHRFYVGHVGIGVAQLLTAGGCGIWWLIDFILVALGGVKDELGRPLPK